MSWHSKVTRTEGPFLRPHHFQQSDRYQEHLLEARVRLVHPCPSGFSHLEIDSDLAQQAKFALRRASGVLPDGKPFDLPADNPLPPPVAAPHTAALQIAWLSMPVAAANMREGDGRDSEIAARFVIDSETFVVVWIDNKLHELARYAADPTAGGGLQSVDYIVLQLPNRHIAALKHYRSSGYLHPERLFEELLRVVGELATFVTQERQARDYPAYDHDDLENVFGPVVMRHHLPGVPPIYLVTAPPQIRAITDHVYFFFDRKSPLWPEFSTASSIGLHFSGDWPGLELELWAVLEDRR